MGRLRGPQECTDQNGLDQDQGLPGCHVLGHRHGRLPRPVRQQERTQPNNARQHEELQSAKANQGTTAKGKRVRFQRECQRLPKSLDFLQPEWSRPKSTTPDPSEGSNYVTMPTRETEETTRPHRPSTTPAYVTTRPTTPAYQKPTTEYVPPGAIVEIDETDNEIQCGSKDFVPAPNDCSSVRIINFVDIE